MSFVQLLKQADIFYEFTPNQLELVAALCEERDCITGEVIFEENAPGGELYIITQGEVEIQVDPSLVTDQTRSELSPVTIATLRRGQCFGEVALVDEGLRSATARCAQHGTHLIIIPREKLMLLCDTYPQLGYRLMRNLAADLSLKLRNTDLQIREELLYGQQRR